MPTILKHLLLAIFGFASLGLTHPACSQDASALQANYDQKLAQWRETIKEIREKGVKYLDADDAITAKQYRKEWTALRQTGRAQVQDLVDAAMELYPVKPSAELADFIRKIQIKALEDGQSGRAFECGQMLLKNAPNNADYQLSSAVAAIKTNRFAEASAFADKFGSMINGLDEVERDLFDGLKTLTEKFARESTLRAQEENADDLPRVRFETTRGDIVVELFENEAPGTVANFISLVESGKYENMTFHRVIKDFMAQTGLKYTDGEYTNMTYTIYDECREEDARFHFYGSLSMANTGQPDSGNVQFFFCHRPIPHLDGSHTVFGRIISGFDTFEEISATHYIGEKGEENELENPTIDHIIKAEVIRKRDHEYEIQKALGN